MDATGLHPDSNPSASLGIGGDLDTDTAIAYFKTVWMDVTESLHESTTNTQAHSTDISIHLSPARRGESDFLRADLVAPTIRLHHSPKQQNLPNTYHKQVQGPQGTDNLTQDLDNLTRRT
jgi:hypothetical protein